MTLTGYGKVIENNKTTLAKPKYIPRPYSFAYTCSSYICVYNIGMQYLLFQVTQSIQTCDCEFKRGATKSVFSWFSVIVQIIVLMLVR